MSLKTKYRSFLENNPIMQFHGLWRSSTDTLKEKFSALEIFAKQKKLIYFATFLFLSSLVLEHICVFHCFPFTLVRVPRRVRSVDEGCLCFWLSRGGCSHQHLKGPPVTAIDDRFFPLVCQWSRGSCAEYSTEGKLRQYFLCPSVISKGKQAWLGHVNGTEERHEALETIKSWDSLPSFALIRL